MNKSICYKAVLASKRWRELHYAKEKQIGYHCEHCGCSHRSKLELHHKHYRSLGRETLNDVELLCRNCHHEADQQRILDNAKILSKLDFLIWWAEKRNINPIEISEVELKNQYTNYLNWLYFKRCEHHSTKLSGIDEVWQEYSKRYQIIEMYEIWHNGKLRDVLPYDDPISKKLYTMKLIL